MATIFKISLCLLFLLFAANSFGQDDMGKAGSVLDSILAIIRGIAGSDGISLWIKAILMGVLLLGGIFGKIWWSIYKRKMREKKAKENRARDQQRETQQNQEENTQAQSDAEEIRNRIRSNNGDT